MKIITVAHQKGGVGKTTLALNIAYCLSEDLRIGITDTDLQGSISEIESFLSGIELVPLEKVIKGAELPYDVVIIDTPPYLTGSLNEIFLISDYVLIPTKPGFLDALAIKATISLFNKAKKEKPELKGGIVMNMLQGRTSVTDEVKSILKEYPIPVLDTGIYHRVSLTRSPMTAGVFTGEDTKAKTEITNLTYEILNEMNQ